MSGPDIAGLAIAVARLCNGLALGLYKIIRKAKNLLDDACKIQHSLVLLTKSLDKVGALFAVSSRAGPLDAREESFRDSIYQILHSINQDLVALKDKLGLEKLLNRKQNLLKDIKTTFKRSLEDEEIKEIQGRVENSHRLLQTHFEMLLLLSSWKTTDRVNDLVTIVENVFTRLLEDGSNMPMPAISGPAPVTPSRVETGGSSANANSTVTRNARRIRYLSAVEQWRDCSKSVLVDLVASGSSTKESIAPSILDGGFDSESPISDSEASEEDTASDTSEPATREATGSVPFSLGDGTEESFPKENTDPPAPEKEQYERELEIEVNYCLKEVDKMIKQEKYAEAANHQQDVINTRIKLSVYQEFPFSEECEMKETLVKLHMRAENLVELNKAYPIIQELVSRADQKDDNDHGLRSRLYQTRSEIEFRQGRFNEAQSSARYAACILINAPGKRSPEEKEWIKEAARSSYRAAMRIPNAKLATVTFEYIKEELGDPEFRIPEDHNYRKTLEWCRKRHFKVEMEGFAFDVCDVEPSRQIRGYSPIHYAIKERRIDMLRSMLSYPCNLDVQMADGTTPLLLACSKDNFDAVKLLLDKGANGNAKDNLGMNGLHRCQDAFKEGSKIARLLLGDWSRSGQIKEWTQYNKTAVHLAAEKGNLKVLQLLLSRGADPNAQYRESPTPLTAAVRSNANNKRNVVELLLSKGADLDKKDGTGCTAEKIAQEKEIKRLLKAARDRKATPPSRRSSAATTVVSDSTKLSQEDADGNFDWFLDLGDITGGLGSRPSKNNHKGVTHRRKG
ncbi:hypothetical protein SAPIO_CDS4894 [Scedosporium apiospermum]|uniref:Uncharacterized protein n=1 Tax=Pseudallescheria apiosperma TaxID=563466 RepID=A0A084G7A5_PSEDA|nr:uncharacterized protein SAPIO_CDS4894 [Scedosporium apiospermum]KEZ43217.1 hypothetical protein SAPIO_CDS4894 [Scedosporium apiospermum]